MSGAESQSEDSHIGSLKVSNVDIDPFERLVAWYIVNQSTRDEPPTETGRQIDWWLPSDDHRRLTHVGVIKTEMPDEVYGYAKKLHRGLDTLEDAGLIRTRTDWEPEDWGQGIPMPRSVALNEKEELLRDVAISLSEYRQTSDTPDDEAEAVEEVERLKKRVDDLEDDLTRVKDERDALRQVVAEMGQRLSGVKGYVEQIDGRVDELEQQFDEGEWNTEMFDDEWDF